MSPKLPGSIKNLVEIQEIKNFKTQKFKHRVKKHISCYTELKISYGIYCSQSSCLAYLISFPIHRITPSFVLKGNPFLKTVSCFHLPIVPTSCVKMSLALVLLLSISASHIATCQDVLDRDKNILYFSENNSLSENFLQYVRQNVLNKRLIVSNKITLNDNQPRFSVEISESRNNTRETVAALTESDGSDLWIPSNTQHSISDDVKQDNFKKVRLKKDNIGEDIPFLNNTFNGKSGFFSLETSTNGEMHSINKFSADDQELLRIVMEGLGLRILPDFSKANISQHEYATKYNEYLDRVRQRNFRELQVSQKTQDILAYNTLHSALSLMTIPHNSSEAKQYRQKRSLGKERESANKSILLKFPLNIDSEVQPSDIEEANIRLLLITSPALAISGPNRRKNRIRASRVSNETKKIDSTIFEHKNNETNKHNKKKYQRLPGKPQKHILNMKVYQLLEPEGRAWIDGMKLEIEIDRRNMEETTSQWLQFDVTKAVESWLINKQRNLGLEIQCDNCFRNGARIIDDLSGDSEEDVNPANDYDLTPVLNIIGRLGTHREKRSKHHHNQMTEKPQRRFRKSDCYKDNQRCCRHTMEVVFKEIKGFEFIIQPKVFDAGYCRGRCPPRYNPAHHHALLQSLIWKQNRTKVPRPCCAPSKLIELEVLHVDEKDNEKLKISTWTDMRVLECACS